MRLEARVTLWLLGMIGAGAAVTGFGITHFQHQSLERQFGDTGRVLAVAVKNSLEVSMLNNAPEDVRKTVRNVQRGGLIKSVAVYRRSGSPWVTSAGMTDPSVGERKALLGSMAEEEPRSASAGTSLTMFVPVTKHPECASCHPGSQRVLGAVGVVLDERPLQRELARSTRNSLYMAAVPLALGLLVSLWAVRRSLLRPLSMVGAAAKRVAAGDLDVRLPAFQAGELASLSKAFNEMASRLQLQTADMRRTLEQLHSDLEGMEEVQSLLASGAGLGEMLARGAAHLGSALGASGVGIWRAGAAKPAAVWGTRLPPASGVRLAMAGGAVHSSAGVLDEVPGEEDVGWVVAPAMRGPRTVAVVGIAWHPHRTLEPSERDLVRSLSGVVAVTVENAELLERLNEKEANLEGLLKKTLAAQEDERRRLARELHDETSQILAAIMMNIDVVDRQLQSRKPYRARLKAVKALAEEAARNLNKVLLDLRPALLDELGLVEALRWYVSQMQEVWGLPVTIEAKKMPRLPEHVEMAAFRIAQEAVANAVRHGAPRSIRMKVAAPDGTVRVEVEDDGSGFDVAGAMAKARTGEAVGLLGMIERAELLGGRLEVQSQPGKGTRISAEIPIGGG